MKENKTKMNCHARCGACCIAPSISTPLPGMPHGKPADVRCVNLNDDVRCMVYEQRPAVCRNFSPSPEYCGASHDEAALLLSLLEKTTSPA